MGGLGSGRRGTRTTVEDCLLLSAERLMRLKLFGPTLYNWGTLIWQNTATGENIASVEYNVDTLNLNSEVRRPLRLACASTRP